MTQEMVQFVKDQIKICRDFGCRKRNVGGRKALVNLETGDYVFFEDINIAGEKGEDAVEKILHKLKGSPNFEIFESVPFYDAGRKEAIKFVTSMANNGTEDEI